MFARIFFSLFLLATTQSAWGEFWQVGNDTEDMKFEIAIRPRENETVAYRFYQVAAGTQVPIPIDYDGDWDVKLRAVPGEFSTADKPMKLLRLAKLDKVYNVAWVSAVRKARDPSSPSGYRVFTDYAVTGVKLGSQCVAKFHKAQINLWRLEKSRWRTEFVAPDGSMQKDTTHFSGDHGHCEGKIPAKLTRVMFDVDKNGFFIRGRWHAAEQSGDFVFQGDNVKTMENFSGKYSLDGESPISWRKWSGTRLKDDDER